MKRISILSIVSLCFCVSSVYAQEGGKDKDTGFMNGYPLRPVSIREVKLDEGFFADRIKTHLDVTFPHVLKKLDPFIRQVHREANMVKGRPAGPEIQIRGGGGLTLVRALEGAGYSLMCRKDPKLESMMDRFISSVDDIVSETGDNFFGIPEASVTYFWATGKDRYMKVSEKIAEKTREEFFDASEKPIKEPPGHGGMEFAHCRLYQGTGNPLYLEMARKFADMRGMPRTGGRSHPKFAPQHLPIEELKEPGGHAGSAGWFHSGLVDVAALTGEVKYADAARRIWQSLVDTRICITGGVGANGGIEGFGPAYYLYRGGYNETCAASGNVFYNYRLFLLTAEAKYFDVMEVTLLNGLLAGVSLTGDKFFYVNTHEANGRWGFNMQHQKGRWNWWKVVCCPGSISRTIPQIPGYMYAHTASDVYVTLYAANRTEVPLPGGKVRIRQETQYPYDGKVLLTVTPAVDGQQFGLRLRIPTWARKSFLPGELYSFTRTPPEWSLRVNGKLVIPEMEKGFAVLEGPWKAGDKVQLDLPMPVQFNTCIDKVAAFSGRVAVTRGPLLYCAEEIDNGMRVQRLAIPKLPAAGQVRVSTISDGILKGVKKISFPAVERLDYKEITGNREFRASLGQPLAPYKGRERPVTLGLVPYYSWDNRGDESMAVWLPHKFESRAQRPLQWVAANKTQPPRSRVGNSSEIIFENRAGRRVKLYWVSYKGKPTPYGVIEPGAELRQKTFSSATWLITDENDKPLGHFIAGAYASRAVIPGSR